MPLFRIMLPALLLAALASTPGVAGAPPDDTAVPGAARSVTAVVRQKRDPFQPLITERKEPVKPPPAPRARPAGLGGMMVAETTVVGIASGPNSRVAILQGREKITYFAKVGDRLYDGVITTIDADKVVFTEQALEVDGKARERAVTKKLYAEMEPIVSVLSAK
jgi:Tfp pilus assembly protein PilP